MLQATHATYRAAAALGGARRGDLPDLEDPADQAAAGPAPVSTADRAAQIAAFVAATGGDT